MVDPISQSDGAGAVACPWCSTAVTAETAVCPSCNAILISEQDQDLPGITSVDAAARRTEIRAPQRSRFLAWLGGDVDNQAPTTAGEVQAIAPPDEAVQREILRLELEAQISNLQAEADSILSDALVEGRVADLPEGLRPLAAAEAAAATPAEIADALVEAATGDSAATSDQAGDASVVETAAVDSTDDASDQPAPDGTDPDQPA